MSARELLQQIDQYRWFHSIDMGNGIITPGTKSLDVHAAEYAAFFDPVEMNGCSVIDIGAWNGAYSFEAKRRGASRVLATDHFTWSDPTLRGRESFDLAASILGLDVEPLEIDVAELSPERVGTFDIVLFLGVFYHLFDPIAGLGNAAKLAREVLIVETFVDMLGARRPAMTFYPGDELCGDFTNWWGPNPQLILALLKSFGFCKVDAAWSSRLNQRVVFHAWRSDNLRRSNRPERTISTFSLRASAFNHIVSLSRRWPWLRSIARRVRPRRGF